MINKVLKNQKFSVSARNWNAMASAVNAFATGSPVWGGESRATGSSDSGMVLVRNDCKTAMKQFCAVALTNLLITPTNNINSFRSSMSVFSATKFNVANNNFAALAIVQEPIAAGKLGRALAMGVTPAMVEIDDLNHLYVTGDVSRAGFLTSSASGYGRIIWRYPALGDQWALLMLGGGSGGDSGYSGQFAVSLDYDGEISVRDKSELGSLVGGHGVIPGYGVIDFPGASFSMNPADGFLCAVLNYDMANNVITPGYELYDFLSELPTNKPLMVIASIWLENGRWNIQQRFWGGDIVFHGWFAI